MTEESSRSPRFTTLVLAVLVAATLVSCLWSSTWGLPDSVSSESTAPWAVDTIAPIGPLTEAYHRFDRSGTEPVIYPLFHYVVLAGAYAPYVAWALLTGRLVQPTSEFPYGAQDPQSFFAALTLIASLVSAIMACGIVLAIYFITLRLFDRRAALWAAPLAAAAPPLAYYGGTSNLDVPYLFWTLLAFWHLIRAAQTQRTASYVLTGVFAALAAATKDQAAGYLWVLIALVPWFVYRDVSARPVARPVVRAALDRRALGAAGAALITFALANNLLFGWEGFVRHVAFMNAFYEQNLRDTAGGATERQLSTAALSARLLVQMMGPAFLLLAAAGLVVALRRRAWLALVLPFASIVYYGTVIAPTSAVSRYLIGIALLAAPFAGLAISAGSRARHAAARVAAAGLGAAALLWQIALVAHQHLTLSRDSRNAMASWVRANVAPGAGIETYTQQRYLPRLAGEYTYRVVGHAYSATSYALQADPLTVAALAERDPDYVMVLADSGLTGDPARVEDAATAAYFRALLDGRAGYHEVARFATPTWLPYRQITSGTQPTTVLLARDAAAAR